MCLEQIKGHCEKVTDSIAIHIFDSARIRLPIAIGMANATSVAQVCNPDRSIRGVNPGLQSLRLSQKSK